MTPHIKVDISKPNPKYVLAVTTPSPLLSKPRSIKEVLASALQKQAMYDEFGGLLANRILLV